MACRPAAAPAPPQNRASPIAPPAAERDRDGDGIPDDRDRCPNEPEDFDMFEDDDGCPDPDNDHDGVADADDACPYTPGPPPRGCPANCVFVTDINDCFADPWIYELHNDARRGRIAEVAADVKKYPAIRQLTIASWREPGETDDVVVRRAAALRDELVAAGVPADHLAIGPVGGDGAKHTVARSAVTITKQRFGEGKFRNNDCTSWGPVYKVAKPFYRCKP